MIKLRLHIPQFYGFHCIIFLNPGWFKSYINVAFICLLLLNDCSCSLDSCHTPPYTWSLVLYSCTSKILYSCTLVLLYSSTLLLFYSCTPVLLEYSCTHVLLHSRTHVLLYSCTPVLLFSCALVLLYSSTPVILHALLFHFTYQLLNS